jgi:tetratricopeptide (TPR) repeat protein
LDRLLDAALPVRPRREQAAAASRLGGLLVLAEARDVFPEAGQVAFAVLHRARASGACDAQLNLAFLVAASDTVAEEDVERELTKADRACPHDPTALWLHGQWQSVASQGQDCCTVTTQRSLAAFAQLRRRFPGSAAGWSGQADVLLRLAYIAADDRQPFTAQSRFARAYALYRRARSLDPAPELGAGEARALAGLRRHDDAAAVQAKAAAGAGRPAALQAFLVEYLEGAGRFADAAREAKRLAREPRFPSGPALTLQAAFEHAALDAEDAQEPLSLGAGRLKPVLLDIAPQPAGASGGGPGLLEDFSFIPRFREVHGLTDRARWCPDWAARRDLVLAGRADAALAGMPDTFRAIRQDRSCSELDARMLAAVAHAEAGDRGRAFDAIRAVQGLSASPGAALYDARQNLWRFARRWDNAARVTAAWMKAAPRSPRAFDQAGEVAFLARDHVKAARMFATSARLSREQTPGWSVEEALGLTKQGAALKLAGRNAEALRVLNTATDVGARALATADTARRALYHAHAQAADVLLRQHRFVDAAEGYEAARQHFREESDDPLQFLEVLHNNQAIAEIYGGNPGAGQRLARRAVSVDPMNPLFRQTEGFALARLDRPVRAAWHYGRAVASDPSLFPAWNDLGVMLARSGRDDAAVAAFRRAIGAGDRYAIAWFNLGVALERRGLRYAPAAQGALGRAFRLDPDLAQRERRLITDERLYFTNLDLSKPLPPKWDFASSQQQSPLPAAGLALLLLLGLQAARAAGARGLAGGASKWLEAARDLLARLPGALTSFAPSVVAVGATLAVFVWPAIQGNDDSAASLALLALGLLALVILVMRARVLVARRLGMGVHQRGWRPALLVAVAGAVAGIPWAPLPVAEPDRPEPRVHLVGPVVAAASGLVLLILSAWLEVPVTRSLGIAAIIMAASMLTPVKPLDGGRMEGATGALTAGLALGGTALLVAVGLL